MLIVKNSEFRSNFRLSLKKWIISSTFPVPTKTQKNSRNSRSSRIIGHPENYVYRITCIPQLFFIPPIKGFPLVIFKSLHQITPFPPPVKPDLNSFKLAMGRVHTADIASVLSFLFQVLIFAVQLQNKVDFLLYIKYSVLECNAFKKVVDCISN